MQRPDRDANHPSHRRPLYRNCRNYLNYGLFEYSERAPIWDLRLDTWYYQTDEALGRMDLQAGPVTREGGVRSLWQQLAAFRDAWAPLARLQPMACINYQEHEPIPAGYFASAPLESEAAFMRAVETGFRAHDHILQGGYIVWDGLVMVRDDTGDMVERWLPDMGFTRFYADLDGARLQDVSQGQPVRWWAYAHMNFVSLFRRDNSRTLTLARERWKQLLALDPTATVDRDESSPAEVIVALVDPPSGAPHDNRALYECNAPRLRGAIAQWERATGHPFQWAASLDS